MIGDPTGTIPPSRQGVASRDLEHRPGNFSSRNIPWPRRLQKTPEDDRKAVLQLLGSGTATGAGSGLRNGKACRDILHQFLRSRFWMTGFGNALDETIFARHSWPHSFAVRPVHFRSAFG